MISCLIKLEADDLLRHIDWQMNRNNFIFMLYYSTVIACLLPSYQIQWFWRYINHINKKPYVSVIKSQKPNKWPDVNRFQHHIDDERRFFFVTIFLSSLNTYWLFNLPIYSFWVVDSLCQQRSVICGSNKSVDRITWSLPKPNHFRLRISITFDRIIVA